ncbi:MAG TPA: four helix bundle protein, partial [Acidimicrobiia bacterium]|nr:four helix bundle protein [Acidimicrobiia bacterium]
QVRRAAVSVAANIAEGCGRRGSREFGHFVDLALGSAFELESHLTLAVDLSFVDANDAATAMKQLDEVKRMLIGLGKRLRSTPK